MGTKVRLQYLVEQFLNKTITDAERAELLDYMDDPLLLAEIGEILGNAYDREEGTYEMNEWGKQQLLQNIFQHGIEETSKKRTLRIWPRVAAAAAIILMVGGVLIYYNHKSVTQQSQFVKNDIRPGGNKAILTLANGQKISLTDAATGAIAKQAGVSIIKAASGQLIYSISNTNHTLGESVFNMVETPKGGQYQVKLPDGTEVWLNAASSLRYPATFESQKQRKVELTGEGYFEVAKDKTHPFIVKTDKEDVEVLGTHFNINAYSNEPDIKTTLLEGLVQVRAGDGNNVRIKPGERAILKKSGKIEVGTTDVEEAVAWKNGKFVFTSESIESIMRKLARWYDVEVVYEGDFSDRPFTGSISRFDNISKILDKITFTQAIHFKVEGRRVTVMK